MSDKLNSIGLEKKDYMGAKSTLCTGCGHDSITSNIISAFYKSGVSPFNVAKLSGIGCSSKTPTYFLNQSHGFNSIHGRMAPLATGAGVANRSIKLIGISGDGDSASIGLGGFAHLIRRNLPMIYIVENNGVYGLTKGQFSATAEPGDSAKNGDKNPFETIDLCSLAIDLGCSFVARSFSGDNKQLTPLIQAAIAHNGTAFIDVISPCVTFANHDGISKSYNHVKEHQWPMQEIGFISPQQEISADYEPGEVKTIQLSDNSQISLKKLHSSHDTSSRLEAMSELLKARGQGHILTGLFYLNSQQTNFIDHINLTEKNLNTLSEEECRPSEKQLQETLKRYK